MSYLHFFDIIDYIKITMNHYTMLYNIKSFIRHGVTSKHLVVP